MTMTRGMCFTAAGMIVALLSSCYSDPPIRPTRSACSNGPDYATDANFPVVNENTSEDPTCVARCGSRAITGGFFPLTALPSGRCGIEGERCKMGIQQICANGSPGRVDAMRCVCQAGEWSCATTEAGASVCAPPPSRDN